MLATDALHTLFGAALIAVGVLLAALADRIRASRGSRASAQREHPSRVLAVPAAIPTVKFAECLPRVEFAECLPHVEFAELLHSAADTKERYVPRAESNVTASTEGGEDVITALVAAGYKKQIASEATWACSAAERTTLEIWTATARAKAGRPSKES